MRNFVLQIKWFFSQSSRSSRNCKHSLILSPPPTPLSPSLSLPSLVHVETLRIALSLDGSDNTILILALQCHALLYGHYCMLHSAQCVFFTARKQWVVDNTNPPLDCCIVVQHLEQPSLQRFLTFQDDKCFQTNAGDNIYGYVTLSSCVDKSCVYWFKHSYAGRLFLQQSVKEERLSSFPFYLNVFSFPSFPVHLC